MVHMLASGALLGLYITGSTYSNVVITMLLVFSAEALNRLNLQSQILCQT